MISVGRALQGLSRGPTTTWSRTWTLSFCFKGLALHDCKMVPTCKAKSHLGLGYILWLICNLCHELLYFFLVKIYLFIFGCSGSSLLCAGFLSLQKTGACPRCTAWASHCGVQQLQIVGSGVVAHWLSCSTACRIFLDQEWKPRPLHWKVDFEPLENQESPVFFFT